MWVLALSVCLVVPNRLWAAADPNVAAFNAVYAQANEHLKQGRYDEAMKTIAAVESAVKENLDRQPGRVINVLMIKARVYSLQMDAEGLERFLAQFEAQYADTPVASWVQRVAWNERMRFYRLTENLPQAVRALEKYNELEGQRVRGQDKTNAFEALSRDFHVHVMTPTEIGDLYRYMGKMELALEKYRPALAYVTAHFESMRAWDDHLKQLFSRPLSPSKYMRGILPTAIRECEAPQDSPLGILGREVACEAEQAEWLLSVGRGYRQQRVLDSALKRYRRAQQALEANQSAIDSLDANDKRRYLELQKQIAKGVDSCNQELARFSENQAR
jgi:tetratricopeptide (TPR) repeat protein